MFILRKKVNSDKNKRSDNLKTQIQIYNGRQRREEQIWEKIH